MPLLSQSISALQSAGSAIFAADAELRAAVQVYTDQVKTAMLENPFDLGNDALFENWKTAARLSQATAQIEAEIKKIYFAAVALSEGARLGIKGLPAAEVSQPLTIAGPKLLKKSQATDAVIKKKAKPRAPKRGATQARPLSGNTAKVWARLLETLGPNDFVKLNKSSLAKEAGLPVGSIGASISKLLKTGHVMEGDPGTFKLAIPSPQ